MKKIILFLSLIVATDFYSQTIKEGKSDFDFDFAFKIHVFKPIFFGNNSLSQAHKPYLGYGFSFNSLRYKNFRINSGYNFIHNSVTDATRVGNFNHTNYHSFYNELSYDFKLYQNIGIAPNIGIGYAKLVQKTGSRDFGVQEGTENRVGIEFNYKIDKTVSFFVGTKFIYSTFIIYTAPELLNYYGISKQFQINLGLKLD